MIEMKLNEQEYHRISGIPSRAVLSTARKFLYRVTLINLILTNNSVLKTLMTVKLFHCLSIVTI